MKCKYCEAELDENSQICPACGRDNGSEETTQAEELLKEDLTEESRTPEQTLDQFTGEQPVQETEAPAEEPAPKKSGKGKVIVAISLCAVLLVALAAVVIVGINGGFKLPENDIFYRESYVVEDNEAIRKTDKVVATMGDKELTNGQLQVFYWMQVYDFLDYYGEYAAYYGMDYTKPLDEQIFDESTGMTWQQYFLEMAIQNWQRYQALELEAEAAGIELDPDFSEYLDNLEENMSDTAESSGFDSVTEMLASDMGVGCDLEDYAHYMRVTTHGYQYFSREYDQISVTEADVENYFTENEEYFSENSVTKDSGDFMDVRHILLKPEGGTTDESGTVTYTEEEWAACLKEAEALLEQWKQGEATEESFAELAMEHSVDTGSNTNGGLYQQLTSQTNFVEEFKSWYMDESRKPGDTGIVRSSHGYHIMYFSASEEIWHYYAHNQYLQEQANLIVDTVTQAHPMEVTYRNIVLAQVELG